jgi:hypothetical protein
MIYLRYNLDVSGSVDKRWGSLMTLKVVASKRERMRELMLLRVPHSF